jgi:mitochondrial chaperone BCS1
MPTVGIFSFTVCHPADLESDWMMFWLSSLPQWRQFRDFSVTTSRLRLDDDAMELEENTPDEQRRRRRPLRFLPSYASSYRMWYKGRYITISRIKDDRVWPPDRSTLVITSVPWVDSCVTVFP